MNLRISQALIAAQLLTFYTLTFVAFGALVWTQPQQVTSPPVELLSNPLTFLALFGIGGIVTLAMVRHISSQRFWNIFFGTTAFVGIYVVGTTLTNRVMAISAAMVTSTLFAIVLLGVRQRTQHMIAHHSVILLAIVGVGVILGTQFTSRAAMLVVAVLAIYDIISVYFTRHMIELARTFFKREAWFGIIIPSKLALWNKRYTALRPGQDALVLGAGDIAIPLVFAAAHLYEHGLTAYIIMSIATLIGVCALLWWYVHLRKGQSIPALPPIAVALFIGHWIILNW